MKIEYAKPVDRFGAEVSVRHCVFGGNLNLSVVRGFARLDLLAAISRPDVYDQVLNPLGTQRLLERKHAGEAVQYALESIEVAPETDPRAFPEIILNARDRSVISIVPDDDSGEIDVTSADGVEPEVRAVEVRIDLAEIADLENGAPRISRVDGNHRLSRADAVEGDPIDAYPFVPFAMFIGLTADQERALFRDINGTQKPMQTAHLDSIRLRLEGPGTLLQSEGGRALWMAKQLATPGHVFDGMVFFGGNTKGPKSLAGNVPPVKINALKSAVQATLREAPRIEVDFLSASEGSVEEVSASLEEGAKQVVLLLNRYWEAVKKSYPAPWQDRKNYVLLQAIGLNAFSRLAADVIQELTYEKKSVEQEDFDLVLSTISAKVSLAREDFPGIAGLAGAKVLYQRLLSAMSPAEVGLASVKQQLASALPSDEGPLGS